jgi:hypothetical protein
MPERFLDATELSPDDKFYYSQIVPIEDISENEQAEIRSSKPIQVRINGGPWQDVRSIEDINKE